MSGERAKSSPNLNKVGILTFHCGANYGGFLQAWNLREAVRTLGHEAEIINYKNPRHELDERFRWRLTKRVRRIYLKSCKAKVFKEACREFAPGSPQLRHEGIDWGGYDAIVVGSDIVWDYASEHFGRDGAYFGVVPGGEKVRWVSYAPSCGKADPAGTLPEEKADGLRRFAHISVRDRGTQQLVRNVTGEEAPIMADPTWLPDPAGTVSFEDTEPVLAVYSYRKFTRRHAEQIRVFARKHGLEVVAYGFYHDWVDRTEMKLLPHDWERAIGRARCLVTGTFHGTLYAIRLGKVFCTIGHEWIRNKVAYPLELVGLEGRMVSDEGEIGEVLAAQFNEFPGDVFSRVTGLRERSWAYLKGALL